MENKEKKGIFNSIYDWFNNLTVKGLLKTILVSFIIIILLLSASSIPSVLSKISSSLSAAIYSVFIPAEGATMTADKKLVNSEETFTVNFKKGDTITDGLFTISYACDSNIDLMSIENNGLKKINCDTPYYLLQDETSINLRAITKSIVFRLVLDGSFENNSTQKTEKIGIVRVTIKNDGIGILINTATTTSTNISNNPTPVTNTSVYAPTYNYIGKTDLAARILQVGLLNSATNLITTRNQFNSQEMVGVKFEVRNDGDANTGPWSFTASLPSISTPTYNSNTQISLRPGESIVFTLGFSNLSNLYQSLITISADPLNIVSETNESNNIITQTITNLGYNTNNNYNNNTYSNGYYDSNGNFVYYNNNTNNGWDYYNNGWNNGNTTLGVTCYALPNNPSRSEAVHWYADAIGGNGNYNFTWNGTDGLNSTSQNPSRTYNSSGLKQATVTVQSGGSYISRTCSVYVI